MAELQHFKILDRPSVQITHCSGRIGLKTRVHAASSWPRDSLPLVLNCSGRIGLKTRMHVASSWPRDSLLLVLIKQNHQVRITMHVLQ